jgi:hypothetical protein
MADEINEIEELSIVINRGIEKAIAAFDKELEDSNFDLPHSIEVIIIEMFEDDGYVPHKTYKIKREP